MPITARDAVEAAAGFAYDTALKFEGLARKWEEEGDTESAHTIRTQGRPIVVALAEYAAVHGTEAAYAAMEQSARLLGVELPWPE